MRDEVVDSVGIELLAYPPRGQEEGQGGPLRNVMPPFSGSWRWRFPLF
jgi:hypothetical protein